jgi:hypothetical protein
MAMFFVAHNRVQQVRKIIPSAPARSIWIECAAAEQRNESFPTAGQSRVT